MKNHSPNTIPLGASYHQIIAKCPLNIRPQLVLCTTSCLYQIHPSLVERVG